MNELFNNNYYHIDQSTVSTIFININYTYLLNLQLCFTIIILFSNQKIEDNTMNSKQWYT